MVGATGFEPATPCSQSRCATKLRHAPKCVCLCARNKMYRRSGRILQASFYLKYKKAEQHRKKHAVQPHLRYKTVLIKHFIQKFGLDCIRYGNVKLS